MIAQIQTIDNEKKLLPIAGSQPSGNPVGSLLFTYRKLQPRNYLYCDGSTFNASQYPALALYLGSNVLPDYRECGVVGAEENTTDTIASHDVYTEGEFKDDQIQNITGKIKNNSTGAGDQFLTDATNISSEGALVAGDNASKYGLSNGSSTYSLPQSISFDASRIARTGTTTHGKSKAVFVYIKAVDGVDVTDEDTFLNTVKNYVDDQVEDANSYSETETLTGGKWIDGKPIYRKILTGLSAGGSSGSWTNAGATVSGVETLIKGTAMRSSNNDVINSISIRVVPSTGVVQYYSVGTTFGGVDKIILEYTKSSS